VEITSLTLASRDGPWLTANGTSEEAEAFEFSPVTFLGGWSESAWGFEAIDTPTRILATAIAGPVTSTTHQVGAEASGTFARFVDGVTYTEGDALFISTAGTLTVTHVEATGPAGAETYIVDGAFDIRFANDTSGAPHLVGSFGNIVLVPYANR
jgi:hypothetical protein